MRILVDATAMNRGGGGICTFLLGMLSGWKQAGFDDEWSIIGMRDLPPEVDELVERGSVERKAAPSAARRILTQQLLLPIAARRSSWCPDLILATTPVIPILPCIAPIMAVVYDLRSFRHPQEFDRATRSYRRVAYLHGLRQADSLLAISEFTGREIARLARRRGSEAQVVHLGADHVDHWIGTPVTEGQGITFGHWTNKRPDIAINAWAILHAEHWPFHGILHVVGTQPRNVTDLAALAEHLKISKFIRIHPFLPETEYRRLFASSSVVLFPSTMEGFGLPVAEAQQLGIPIICSAIPAAIEVGGDAALYAIDGSAAAFAHLCAGVLFDPVRRERIIRRGRKNAEAFTWKHTAEAAREEMERTILRSQYQGPKHTRR